VPHEGNELEKADFMHLDAGVGLEAPAQVRTPPRGQVVAASGIPEEAEDVAHKRIIRDVARGWWLVCETYKPQTTNRRSLRLQFVFLHQVAEAAITQLQDFCRLRLNTVGAA